MNGTWTTLHAAGEAVPAAEPVQLFAVGTDAAAQLAANQVVGVLPLAVDLVLYRGDDFFLDVAVVDPTGGAVDLTGYTATAQVRLDTESIDPVASFAATVSGNLVHLRLPTAQSALLMGDAVWDVQVADPSGVITTLAAGALTATPDVTRP